MTYIETARDILREELARVGKGNQETPFEHAYLMIAMASETPDEVTADDVHDAWSIVRMVNRPWHKDIVEFADLEEGVAEYDMPFVEAIRATVRRLKASK